MLVQSELPDRPSALVAFSFNVAIFDVKANCSLHVSPVAKNRGKEQEITNAQQMEYWSMEDREQLV